MPTYNIKDLTNGEVKQEFMSIADMEALDSTKFQVVMGTPLLVSGLNQKPDVGFREVLHRIKRGNPGSTVHTFD